MGSIAWEDTPPRRVPTTPAPSPVFKHSSLRVGSSAFMSSLSSAAAPNPCRSRLHFHKNAFRSFPPRPVRIPALFATVSDFKSAASVQIYGSEIRRAGCKPRQASLRICAMDGDPGDFSSFDEFDGNSMVSNEGILSFSEDEDNDAELLVIPSTDAEFPHRHDLFDKSNAVAVATHRFSTLQRRRRRHRIQPGAFINVGLMAFITILLLLFDWCSWKIVRLPLRSLFLTRPFAISAILASFAGFLYIPIVETLKIHQMIRKEGPARHALKNGTPTMGGLFFIPVGITVAWAMTGFSSVGVCGAATATIAFAVIGLLDDILSSVKNHNYGLSSLFKFCLLASVSTWFSCWLDSADISLPYSMKFLVPFPAPLGLVYFGKFYLFFSAFCFVSMGNGVNLTDGLDGLAGGTAALAFVGMSIAVLPICSELGVFGASMAGACVGFLTHNGYKASIFMGDTGSLALGGALAAMAACTGMFFPLLIASGVFVIEVLSVIMQVSFFKATRRFYGVGRRLFRMAPLHHHLELCGMMEPQIVTSAYIVSSILALLSAYVGLISV